MSERVRVCVVGAGVVGLTTATLLQETRPDVEVTIIAEQFLEQTVSHVAAGIFFPYPQEMDGPDEETVLKWLKDSYKFYSDLLQSSHAEKIGIRELETVKICSTETDTSENPWMYKVCPDYRHLTQEELSSVPGAKWINGIIVKTILTECGRYLPYLTKKFELNGGTIIKRKIESLEELAGQYDGVVNCSGMGGRELCGDTEVIPVRGQVIRVKAPWIQRAYFTDNNSCYVIPGIDHVTVGGVYDASNWSTDVSESLARDIWERNSRIIPSLKDAQIISQHVGLRPYRKKVRVEAETIRTKEGKTLQVVHNYGHGSQGVCTAPGTSKDAIIKLLNLLPKRSKL